MFTASKIKLIYCYLMCFFIGIFFIFKATELTKTYIKLNYFEETYTVPYSLTKASFHVDQKKLTHEQIEHLRLDAIEDDKKNTMKSLKSDVVLDLPFLFYSLILLALHVTLIRRTKE